MVYDNIDRIESTFNSRLLRACSLDQDSVKVLWNGTTFWILMCWSYMYAIKSFGNVFVALGIRIPKLDLEEDWDSVKRNFETRRKSFNLMQWEFWMNRCENELHKSLTEIDSAILAAMLSIGTPLALGKHVILMCRWRVIVGGWVETGGCPASLHCTKTMC